MLYLGGWVAGAGFDMTNSPLEGDDLKDRAQREYFLRLSSPCYDVRTNHTE